MNQPFVSVIVPAKNSAATLEKCVCSLINLDYPAFEIIVVDDGSTDLTAQILKKFNGKIRIITNKSCLGPSRARNIAAQEAKGELLAFTDSDCIVEVNWLSELASGFNAGNIVSVGGIQRIPEDESVFGKKLFLFMCKVGFISDYIHTTRVGNVRVNHNPSCNAAYRRDVFLNSGGFLEGFWPGEDVELDHRLSKAGHILILNPRAVAYHYRPQSVNSFAKMMFRYGFAQGLLVKKYGFFRKIHFVPVAALFLLLLPAVSLFTGIFYLCLSFLAFGMILFFIYFQADLLLNKLFLTTLFNWNRGFFQGLIIGKAAYLRTGPIHILAINPVDDTYGSTHRFRKFVYGLKEYKQIALEYIEPNSKIPGVKTFIQKNSAWGFISGTFRRAYYSLVKKYDLLFVQTVTPLTVPALFIARLRKKKIAVDWDDLSWVLQKSVLRELLVRFCEHNFLWFADVIFVPNRYLKEYGLKHGARRIEYVSHGIDRELFDAGKYDTISVKSKLGIPLNHKVVGFLASFTTGGVSDLDFIFSAMHDVFKLSKDVSFLIIGGGPLLQEYKNMAEDARLKNTYFTGWIQQAEVPLYLSAISLGIIYMRQNLANKYKTSLKVAEYLAMHKPVVGCLTGETRDNFSCFCSISEANKDSFVRQICACLEVTPVVNWQEVDDFLRDSYSWDQAIHQVKDAAEGLL